MEAGGTWRWVWPADPARRYLSVLLLLFALQQLLIVLIFPPFSGHDEVAHFDYIRLIAREHRLPRIPDLEAWREAELAGEPPPGHYLAADLYPYCLFELERPCAPDDPLLREYPPYRMVGADGDLYPAGWQYAGNHPPLFYLLAAPVQRLIDGAGLGLQLRLLRLLAIPFGLLVVAGTFALARAFAPGSGFLPVTAATFVAFQPQLVYSAAILNNDITVVATGAWLMTLLLLGLRAGFGRRRNVEIGLLLGVSLLFKSTALVFVPAIAVAVIAAAGWRNVGGWARRGFSIAAIGFGLASPWYIHLWRHYGNFDALDQVEALQAGWNYPQGAPSFLELLFSDRFLARFWREAWGDFGWRRIPLESGLLWIVGIFCLLCLAGLLYGIAREARGGELHSYGARRERRASLLVLVVLVTVAYVAVVQFGTRFELAQARYTFAAMPAAAVLLLTGLQVIVPLRARPFAQIAFAAGALALTIYIYSASVIPYWYMGPAR